MTLWEFLRDNLLSIAIKLVALAFLILFLHVLQLPPYAIGFLAGLLLAADTGAFLIRYFRRREFYNTVRQTLSELDKKHLLSELLAPPSFIEGIILYEAVTESNKSMNDEIAKYHLASEEYREYIETWVHEIKTPIAAGQLIAENNPSPAADALREELERIEGYVEQALFYSRSNNVERDYIIAKYSLSNLVTATLKKYSRVLIQHHVSIQMNGLDQQVYTDQKWFGFILGQLLANAVQYRSETPLLYFQGTQTEHAVILSVRDNGIGIREADLPRIFEKGFTGQTGRTYRKSTGIGLYLCKKLCGKMGLGIEADSTAGEGSEIRIVFPKNRMVTMES